MARAAGSQLFGRRARPHSPMTDLATLERAFAATLVARMVGDADVSAFVGAPERVRARLGLYRGNVQANAVKALTNAYPVVAKLVGDDFMTGLARAFAAATRAVAPCSSTARSGAYACARSTPRAPPFSPRALPVHRLPMLSRALKRRSSHSRSTRGLPNGSASA